MATVSISEAARLAGVSRKTIQRHIASGKLSATLSQGANASMRQVEISELMRVYGQLDAPVPATSAPQVLNLSHSDDALRQVIDIQKEAIGILKTQVDELKIEKKELRAQLAGFLEYTKPTPVQIPMNYRITIGILAIVVIAMAIAVYLRLQ